jgi:hypothetical protein
MTTLLFGGDKFIEKTPIVGDIYNKTPVVKDVVSELQVLEMPRDKQSAKTTTDMFCILGIGIIGFLYITATS